jgi:hypothetical protein
MAIARFADVAQAGFGTRIADRLRRAGGELADIDLGSQDDGDLNAISRWRVISLTAHV